MLLGAATSRYLLVGMTRDRALVEPSAIMMADAFVAMLQLFGTGLLTAIRAALVPSRPRRTLIITAVAGVPAILATSLLLPADGALELRPLDSPVFPWLPVNFVIMWAFVVITCTLISRIIYGLRVEVREARRLGQYVLEEKIGEGGMGAGLPRAPRHDATPLGHQAAARRASQRGPAASLRARSAAHRAAHATPTPSRSSTMAAPATASSTTRWSCSKESPCSASSRSSGPPAGGASRAHLVDGLRCAERSARHRA